jgi:hypothetical protein
VKYYNKGIAAHLEAMLELLDDDHLLFTNVQGIGPIDIVRVNIKSGKVDFFDAKSDRESRHKKRPITEIQKKLGVKHIYINLRKKTFRLKEFKK